MERCRKCGFIFSGNKCPKCGSVDFSTLEVPEPPEVF